MASKKRKESVRRRQCGTVAGYRQHTRRGEKTCEDCRRAHREYMAEYKRNRSDSPRKQTQEERREADERRGERLLDAAEKVDESTVGADGYPRFLRRGGRELWDAVRSEYDLPPTGEVLLLEACRLKDRLDKFTAALASNSTLWFELKEPEELMDGSVQMQVVVNSMVSEARQAQAALGQTLNKIGVLQSAERKRSGGGIADEIRRKREERLRRSGS